MVGHFGTYRTPAPTECRIRGIQWNCSNRFRQYKQMMVVSHEYKVFCIRAFLLSSQFCFRVFIFRVLFLLTFYSLSFLFLDSKSLVHSSLPWCVNVKPIFLPSVQNCRDQLSPLHSLTHTHVGFNLNSSWAWCSLVKDTHLNLKCSPRMDLIFSEWFFYSSVYWSMNMWHLVIIDGA